MNRTKYTSLFTLLFLCGWIQVPIAKASSSELKAAIQRPSQRGNAAPHQRALSFRASAITARSMAVAPPVNLPAPTTTVGFQAAPHISSGTSAGMETLPYLCALGDFRGNSQHDVAAIVQDANNAFWLSILLSNGNGTFQAPTLTSATYATSDLLTVGDLNHDGKADVVLVHSGSIDVFIGDGTGNFVGPVNYPTSIPNPVAVALIDTNADTFIDVVVANGTPDLSGNSPVSTLLGNGAGAFGAPSTKHYTGTMTYGVLADVNGDGVLDLVSNTQVFMGSATDFQAPIMLTGAAGNACAFPFGTANGSVIVADVTGDGKPDILTADCSNQTITAFVNLGSGSFSAGKSTWAAYSPATISVADVNGDGKLDAIVGDFYSMDVVVLFGNGDGTFAVPPLGYPAGGDLWAPPVIADFNSDGHPDVVVPSGISGQWSSLVYLAGLGGGTFLAPHDYFFAGGAKGTASDSWGIATADLNGDGLPDFVVGNLSSDPTVGVTVFLSNPANPNQSLGRGVNYGSGGNLQFVALADINGDGTPDLVASNTVPGTTVAGEIQIFLGNSNGTFQTPPTIFPIVSGSGLGQLVVGDFNGDGKPDIAVLDTGTILSNQTFPGYVWILINNTTPGSLSLSFASPVSYSLTSPGGEIAAADLGNSHLDLVITQSQSTAVSILLGDGKGAFVPSSDFDLGGFYPVGLAIAKLNPSPTAHPDLVVAIDDSNAGMGIAVATGNGDGTFNAPVCYPATSSTTGTITPFPAEVKVADLNGDGNLDLVFTNFGDGAVGVLYGTGQWGSGQSPFYAPVEFAANDSPLKLLLVDVNGDGALDAVIDSTGYSGLTTFLNNGANYVTLSSSANPSTSGTSVTFTATVAALPVLGESSVSPSGTVTFNDNLSGSLGTVTLSGGVATVSTSSLGQGTHVVTAIYSGDNNFAGQTKGTLVQNMNGTVLPTYSLSATPTTATLHPGQSATFVVTATPNPTYIGTVSFGCGTLPAGVTCSFNPPSINLSGISPASTTLTVTVAPNFVASADPIPTSNTGLPLVGATFGVLGCVSLGAFWRRDRRMWTSALLFIAIALVLAATGCSSPASKPVPVAAATPIKVMVTSRGNANQLNLSLTILP
jgi:hypothetical protein